MAGKMWYRMTCKGYVVLTQRLYSKLETEKLFLTKDVMCEGCFKEDLRCNGLRGSSEENAEKFNGFCIDMVCDENELHDLLENMDESVGNVIKYSLRLLKLNRRIHI
jgi:hypothetical protein